jgi:hypothetical protein
MNASAASIETEPEVMTAVAFESGTLPLTQFAMSCQFDPEAPMKRFPKYRAKEGEEKPPALEKEPPT